MKTLTKNILWAVITFLVITTAFSIFYSEQKKPQVLTIDQVAQKINANQVSKITVSGTNVDIHLKDNSEAVSTKEAETGLIETLKSYGVSNDALQKVNFDVQSDSGWSYWMSILIPSILPLIIIGFFFWIMFRQAKTGMSQAFTFGKANIKLFTHFKDRVMFSDVAGLKEAKQELIEVVDFLKNPKKYLDIGARIPRGVLLLGSPGTGKTLLARAIAGEGNVPFFHMSGSEFVEMFVGVGSSRVRDLFDTAKRAAPCIIFIDEIDAIGRERGAGIGGGHDEREQTLNQILVEMDGFERDTKVIVVAATNRPDVLDAALLRPGRFDRRVILELPDINDREEVLKIHSKGKLLAKDMNLRKVAERTPGFSGADLANLMNEAAILAARKNQKEINQQDILESVEKVLLGPERRSRALSNKEKEITAYHEAGHALVTASLKGSDPVHKVSIVARGRAGGYTLKLPLEETHLRTKSQFLNDLAILLGGYVSEGINFKDISTGASNDLQVASDLARSLVTRYGMSEKMGPVTYGKTEEMVFLGRELTTQKNYSERIASEIDAEVTAFIQRALRATRKIITSRGNVLKAIADKLMEKETLEQEEFKKIVDAFKLRPLVV
ncbi:MAG: ATP-dependent zinc metalloprotease FtsH [Candidatus Wolfebacteria bacterium]|nr:ATP-dependent zinc metalloprotease FtsH [Candidatus Wolfebacteria bacterium]